MSVEDRGGPERRLFRLGLGEPSPSEAVDWEIEHHLQEETERLVAGGWSPAEARDEAERRFGMSHASGLRRRETRRVMMRKTTAVWDVARGSAGAVVRGLRRQPGFTLGIVLTLGLGIGANAAMFGIIDRLLLRPPAHVDGHERLRRLALARGDWVGPTVTYPDFLDQEAHSGFEGVAASSYARNWTLGSGPDASKVKVRLVSHDYFSLLGAVPALGRVFTDEEDSPEAQGTAVVGHRFWSRRLGGAPDVIGTVLEIEGDPYTVVGVAPEGFTGVELDPVDVWLPIEVGQYHEQGDTDWRRERSNWWLYAVARLADGVSEEAARDEATALARNGRREDLERGRHPDLRVELWPLIGARGPEASEESRVARWLGGVSLIVLLIACANIANLLLARSVSRRREVAVRLALGVSRRALVARMILESVGLGLLGGVFALGLARWGGELLRQTLLPDVLFPSHAMDPRVIGFTLAVSLLAGLLAGVPPALQATRGDVAAQLGEGTRGASLRRSRLRTVLTVLQAALSVVLLVGAGLFVRSLDAVSDLDLGLDADPVVLARLEFMDDGLTVQDQIALYDRASERLRTLPGVESVAATSIPFGWSSATRLEAEGVDSVPRMPGGGPYYYGVRPGYFETLGLEILKGRGIRPGDGDGGERVAVVSETMARELWPDGEALGRCLLIGREPEGCTTVVGVVEDASRGSLQTEPYMAYYLPIEQQRQASAGIYVRARDGDAAELVGPVASLLRGLSPEIRFATAITLREGLDPQARAWSLGAAMFTLFGLLALVVAGVGLYSVLAFEVAQRTRELGIRTALGARRKGLLAGVVAEGLRLAALGIAAGLAAAWVLAPRVEALLFGVSPRDLGVLAAALATLVLTAVLASLLPGIRATRVDPAEALRAG